MSFVGASQGALGVIAGYTSSYTNRTPYITVAEYQAAPTAIDINNLIEGGTTAQQSAALGEIIGRASSWIDTYCTGAQGTLCATVNQETGRILSDRLGRWVVHPRYWPILEVRPFAVGMDPATVNSVALTPSNVWIEEQQFIVSNALGLTSSQGPLEFSPVGWPGAEGFAAWTYVNGWVNTLLANSPAQGATSIQVASATGVYPGSTLTIYDAPNDEIVTVANTYVEGNTTVPLVTGLAQAHSAGVSVSALPPAVKQAAIFLTTALIKSRGDDAIILSDSGEPAEKASGEMLSAGDQAIAAELLDPFRLVWGQR